MLIITSLDREDNEAALHHAHLAYDIATTRDAQGWRGSTTPQKDEVTIDRCIGLSASGIGDALEELGRFDEAVAADIKYYFSHPRLAHRNPPRAITRRGE